MDFAFENLVAVDFVNLDKFSALAVLEARNAVREFMLTSREISEAEHFRFIESLRNDKRNAYFAVYECESSDKIRHCEAHEQSEVQRSNPQTHTIFLGAICLNQIDFANKNANMGIYSVVGANNGANLLKMLKFIAFSELNLHILYAKVLDSNSRALRFYAKNGFVRCGKLIEAIKRGDRFVDLEILALKNALESSLRDFAKQNRGNPNKLRN